MSEKRSTETTDLDAMAIAQLIREAREECQREERDRCARSHKKKYTASRADIVNDFYDVVESLRINFRYEREAQIALDRIEDIVIWWSNTPAVVAPEDDKPPTQTTDKPR